MMRCLALGLLLSCASCAAFAQAGEGPVFMGIKARDDYFHVAYGVGRLIDPSGNDNIAWYIDELPRIRIVEGPRQGELTPVPTWGGAFESYRYVPAPGFMGRDHFRYELCPRLSQDCTQARVEVDVRPHVTEYAPSEGRTGGWRLGLEAGNFPVPLDAVRYLPSPLVSPWSVEMAPPPDRTPADPWDAESGMGWQLRTLPAAPPGEVHEFRILVDSRAIEGTGVDAYVGVDEDGDGKPSADEQRCFDSGLGPRGDRCETILRVGADPVTYWVAGHSVSPYPAAARFEVYEVPAGRPEGSLVVTGPASVAAGAPMHLQLSWQDDRLLEGDRRVGLVSVVAGDGTPAGDFVVWVERSGAEQGMPLRSGQSRQFDLAPGAAFDRAFIDVPEGATRLDVETQADGGAPFYLVRHPGGGEPGRTAVVPAPPEGAGSVASTGAGDLHSARIEGGALHAGRWYVVPRNPGSDRLSVTVRATLQAVAPRIRPGSYFNPERPGSGLMLYPAGDQWVGLWFTYEATSNRPVWYQLQAPAPAADGLWHGKIYRQARVAGVSEPTAVGEAIVTPMGQDLFAFTYTLDGQAGSEIYSPLGRGCPSLGGQPVDISAHWFDPARAGTGFSVQTWPDYELIAAFTYDEQGSPLHLVAERQGFGGAEASLPLYRLLGPCPGCEYAAPIRSPAGTLDRSIEQGRLSRIRTHAAFDESWPLAPDPRQWVAIDDVEVLGGNGATQGCAP